MSGKTTRLLRQQLRVYKFPNLTNDLLQGVQPGRPEVKVNHIRRIRGLMKSEQLTIADAITRHCKQTGMTPKPKN